MKANRKNILVPVDFTEQSEKSIQSSIHLAKFLNAKVYLLYVHPSHDFIHAVFSDAAHEEIVKKEAEKKLLEIANKYNSQSNIEFDTLIRYGKIGQEIINASHDLKTRFIIMTRDVKDAMNKRSMGSILLKVVRDSLVPVITIPYIDECRIDYSRILVPLDLSKSVRESVYNAIAFGIHYNAEIFLYSVVIGNLPLRNSRIYSKMKKYKKLLTENGISCFTHLDKKKDNSIHELILNYSTKCKADILMIMTHQEHNYDNYIGALASEIINQSEIPVLSLTSAAAHPDAEALVKPIVDPLNLIIKD